MTQTQSSTGSTAYSSQRTKNDIKPHQLLYLEEWMKLMKIQKKWNNLCKNCISWIEYMLHFQAWFSLQYPRNFCVFGTYLWLLVCIIFSVCIVSFWLAQFFHIDCLLRFLFVFWFWLIWFWLNCCISLLCTLDNALILTAVYNFSIRFCIDYDTILPKIKPLVFFNFHFNI